jgi:hypothetical protein
MSTRSKWRNRIIVGAGAALFGLAINATPASAVTVNNNFVRTCDQNRTRCSSWQQINGAYVSYVGSTCTETDRMWGWAWVTATYRWTTPPGVRC